MAAEKQRGQSGNQSIVDQDAAITAYLDGLLRDPEQDEAAPATRSRKTPGLKVIAPEAGESDTDMVSIDAMSTAAEAADAESAVVRDESDEMPTQAAEPVADESLAEPGVREEDETESAPVWAEESISPASRENNEPDDAVAVAADTPAASQAMSEATRADEEEIVASQAADEQAMAMMAAEPESPVEETEPSPWAWLRVGGMTLAIPADAVVSRHVDAALDPVPGAPAQVAGALSVDGRPRLILSLANVTGARSRGDVAEILLLGPSGLWGVVGEPAEPPEAFDADTVQWRSESQKADRRGWLAGTSPAAGVAVLDVAGLRAALKGS